MIVPVVMTFPFLWIQNYLQVYHKKKIWKWATYLMILKRLIQLLQKNGDFEFILKFHKKQKSFSKHLHL